MTNYRALDEAGRRAFYLKTKEWRQRNPDKVKAMADRAYIRHKARVQAYTEGRKTEKSLYDRERRRNNLEAERAADREYGQAHKHLRDCTLANSKRRSKKEAVNEHWNNSNRLRVLDQFQHACFRCASTLKLHIDHHFPLTAGYALAYGNAVVLCCSCNTSKHDKLPEQFYSPLELKEVKLYLDEQLTWIT